MMISAHKTRSVFDRYNAISESDLADAARKIEPGSEKVVFEREQHEPREQMQYNA